MATTKSEYTHWQQKNNEAFERIAQLESQIASLKQQCEERLQQELAVANLKHQLKRYSLEHGEYMALLSKLNLQVKRTPRDTGLSETTTFAPPDVKASIAVKQLTAKISIIMTQKMKQEPVDGDFSGISEPILALLRSSTVEPSMILEQMKKTLDHIQDQTQSTTQSQKSQRNEELNISQTITEQETLCEEREAQADENLKKQQALKYQADELVRQIKAKITSNYPDDEVQRMLLKYILSKTQKQRYHIKVQRLQELVMQMEQQHGFVNNSTQDSKDDIARQTNKLDIINQLHLQIDELNLRILQQLEQSKKIANGDEKALRESITQARHQLMCKFQEAVDMLSNREVEQLPSSVPMKASDVNAIRRQLHTSPSMDLVSILRYIQHLKAEANSELDAEDMCNEQYTRSKEKLQNIQHDLSSLSLVDEKDSDSSLASTAEKFVVHIQQQQVEFWNDHHETLQHSMQKYKENAIDSIQQIQLCLNERNEMLQGELLSEAAQESLVHSR